MTAPAPPRDTIFALSSAPGRGAIAVVRVSGPAANAALAAITHRPLPEVRKASLRRLFDKTIGVRIDEALVVRMAGPRSETGEDTVELFVHGGRAVVTALLETLAIVPGLRPAERGEFTRRAVENGKLDLTQAEAIADLVAAETDAQRRQALEQMEGGLGSLYDDWRARIIRAGAWLEASIDFADEDIPADALEKARSELNEIAQEIQRHLNDRRRGEILRDGFHVAVIGPPNVGKSSLVNALAQRDVAIVSETPGTTRDVIEVHLDLEGYPVILADTAGLREPTDHIEGEGVRRARVRAESADLRLLVLDGADQRVSHQTDVDVLSRADLVVFNKADLVPQRSDGFWISAKSGEGIDVLVGELARVAASRISGDGPALTRVRHRQALEKAAQALIRASAADQRSPELSAENVRVALNEIGRITGRVDLDELLDVVFRDFCIGK